MDSKVTKKDYNNEMELKQQLEIQISNQNKILEELQVQLAQLEKEKEELSRQQSKNEQDINRFKLAKQDYFNQGKAKLEDLNNQLEKAKAEQSQCSQIDQNLHQEPTVVRLNIKSKQIEDENGKLKVKIEFDNNYTQIEIQERLLEDKKSVELQGYAILDFTLFFFNQKIELQKQVQQRESIQLDGLELIIIYK
ncbi:unnamed protein product [Paramecium pentaurelia]|uniref:Uncharacterized protein n=1 Tax=Paramecium pentaurelia TaxID=43138 RepID=A0A8S1Y9P7_9CILI|nr:unnamed protein product [Paramecium pentaurelia]